MRFISRIDGEVDALKSMTISFLCDVMTDIAYSNYGRWRKISDVFARLLLEEAAQTTYLLKEVVVGR